MNMTKEPIPKKKKVEEKSPHYKAYKARKMTKEQLKEITFLFGGLTWKHERLLEGAFQNMGIKAQAMPNVTRADLDTGKELIDSGACCPTTFVTGGIVNFMKEKVKSEGLESAQNNYAYLTAGACGACRFGQYHESYTMALDSIGLSSFRILLLEQDKVDQEDLEGGAGLPIDIPFTTGAYLGIFIGDILTDLEYMTRPYEVQSGQTDEVLKTSADWLYQLCLDRPIVGKKWGSILWNLTTSYFIKAVRKTTHNFDEIKVNRLQVKPKVKITGEFWVQTHEGDGNYNIKRWLESEGAEVIAPSVATWIDYLLRIDLIQALEGKRETLKFAWLKIKAARAAQKTMIWVYDRLRKAASNLPHALPDQYELQRLAEPYYHKQLNGGEGDMLVGKSLWAYNHNKAHMICELSPYSCMPNTMSVGAMANVTGKYPDLLYAPIEIKGDAEIHALSRCQMILTEAKKKAKAEFETVLETTGLTIEKVQEYEKSHPELTKASYYIPHYGIAGTAANYVVHVSKLMGLKNKYKKGKVVT